jgi:hypothetical protein
VAALEARRDYDPERAPSGTIKPLARAKARTSMRRWIIAGGAPVSLPNRWGSQKEVVGTRRASVEKGDRPDERFDVPGVAVERWRALVVVRVREVLGAEAEPYVDEAMACVEKGRPLSSLSMRALDALAALGRDDRLRELWEARR